VQPIDRRIVNNALQLPSYQSLYFSKIKYAPLELPGTPLIVTGIANPRPLFQHISELYPKTELLDFSDHHVFSDADVQRILNMAKRFSCVVTTEKDYMRMLQTPLVEQLGDKLKLISIKTDLGIDKDTFDRGVMLYVAENNRKTLKKK
jgi:tetraacyldisaccharide 4'-kinase